MEQGGTKRGLDTEEGNEEESVPTKELGGGVAPSSSAVADNADEQLQTLGHAELESKKRGTRGQDKKRRKRRTAWELCEDDARFYHCPYPGCNRKFVAPYGCYNLQKHMQSKHGGAHPDLRLQLAPEPVSSKTAPRGSFLIPPPSGQHSQAAEQNSSVTVLMQPVAMRSDNMQYLRGQDYPGHLYGPGDRRPGTGMADMHYPMGVYRDSMPRDFYPPHWQMMHYGPGGPPGPRPSHGHPGSWYPKGMGNGGQNYWNGQGHGYEGPGREPSPGPLANAGLPSSSVGGPGPGAAHPAMHTLHDGHGSWPGLGGGSFPGSEIDRPDISNHEGGPALAAVYGGGSKQSPYHWPPRQQQLGLINEPSHPVGSSAYWHTGNSFPFREAVPMVAMMPPGQSGPRGSPQRPPTRIDALCEENRGSGNDHGSTRF